MRPRVRASAAPTEQHRTMCIGTALEIEKDGSPRDLEEYICKIKIHEMSRPFEISKDCKIFTSSRGPSRSLEISNANQDLLRSRRKKMKSLEIPRDLENSDRSLGIFRDLEENCHLKKIKRLLSNKGLHKRRSRRHEHSRVDDTQKPRNVSRGIATTSESSTNTQLCT
jgi:hypothetical protein